MQAHGVDLLVPEEYHDRGTRVMEPPGRRAYHQRVERQVATQQMRTVAQPTGPSQWISRT